MKKQIAIVCGISGAVILAYLFLFEKPPESQVYRGKTIRAWALQLTVPNQSPGHFNDAVSALQSLGGKAVPALIKLLHERDPIVNSLAWSVSSRLPSRMRPWVHQHLPDRMALVVRQSAAVALGIIGADAQAAIPDLEKAFRKDDLPVRWAASSALGTVGGKGTDIMVAALSEMDVNGRYMAAVSLGQKGVDADKALPALLQATGDRETIVRLTAEKSLSSFGERAVLYLTNVFATGDAPTRRRAATALVSFEPPLNTRLATVLELLHDPEEACRLEAVHLMGMLGLPNKRKIDALIGAASDSSSTVRVAAIEALGQQGRWQAASAVAALRGCLGDESASIREAAAKVLGALGPRASPALPDLQKLGNDKEENVRIAAKAAVATIEESTLSTGQ